MRQLSKAFKSWLAKFLYRLLLEGAEIPLPDGDYILKHNAAWFTLGENTAHPISVRIRLDEDIFLVDVYKYLEEGEDPILSYDGLIEF